MEELFISWNIKNKRHNKTQPYSEYVPPGKEGICLISHAVFFFYLCS